jgi:amidophosphoribosyltransferase
MSTEGFVVMCGIFGVHGHAEAANLTYLGLHALQHRGQESAGIVATDGEGLTAHRAVGLVADTFDEETLAGLPGKAAIGHVRYSTAGGSGIKNAQPLMVEYARGQLAVAHNGNLVNADELRQRLSESGSIFQSTTDTEVIVHLIARRTEERLEDRIAAALREVRGAYSLLFLAPNALIAVRDPRGVRPLFLGRLKDAAVIASETCAFDLIEAELTREIEPGEMIVCNDFGVRSLRPFGTEDPRFCVFEHIYFARPDGQFGGRSVYASREAMGRQLAKEHPVEADVVVPVPDSGIAAAIGYARESGIPYAMGLIRSHYVGRTFIEPQQSIRHFGVKLKLSAVREVLRDKRVVVIDDSIVRGTTSRKIMKIIRAAGARQVHLRISSPPTTNPCRYGIDTPTRDELIAASHTPDEIARYITCDSLGYLSRDGMLHAAGANGQGKPPYQFCDACFSGEYPIPLSNNTEGGQVVQIGLRK